MPTVTEKAGSLSELARERYISITTFRRDGSEASTPVWVVSDDPHRLLVATGLEGTYRLYLRLTGRQRAPEAFIEIAPREELVETRHAA